MVGGPAVQPVVKWKKEMGNITTALKDHDLERKETEKLTGMFDAEGETGIRLI